MAPPWIILATDRTEIGAEIKAVKRGKDLKFTLSLERARRFSDEPAATMFTRKCQNEDGRYLFTPYKLY